jgi:hypothetical protein
MTDAELEEWKYASMSKMDWWDVCRIVRPDVDWDEFERMWVEFEAFHNRRTLQ